MFANRPGIVIAGLGCVITDFRTILDLKPSLLMVIRVAGELAKKAGSLDEPLTEFQTGLSVPSRLSCTASGWKGWHWRKCLAACGFNVHSAGALQGHQFKLFKYTYANICQGFSYKQVISRLSYQAAFQVFGWGGFSNRDSLTCMSSLQQRLSKLI